MNRRRTFALCAALAACSAPEAEPPFWRPSYDALDGAASSAPPGTSGSTDPPDGGGASGALPSGGTTADASTPATDAGVSGNGGIVAPCSLRVSVTTAAVGGQYAPNNIVAIWIADDANAFVKTLDVFANRRIEHLERWGAMTTAAGVPGNTVDAVTGATRLAHGVLTATWDCTDFRKKVRPDGAHRVCFELTDSNKGGPVDCVPFVKGAQSQVLNPSDTPHYKGRNLVFTP